MQTVLRHSGRLCSRVSKRRLQQCGVSAVRHSSDWRPEDRDKTQRHDSARKSIATKEQDVTEDAAEVGDGRRSGFRRTLRQRKPADIPKPPALPAWFLKRNVVLQAKRKSDDNAEVLECVDNDTGKTLFTLSCNADTASRLTTENNNKASSSTTAPTPEPLQSGAASFTPELRLTPARAAAIQVQAIVNATFALAGVSLPVIASSKAELSLQTSDPQGHAFLDSYVVTLAEYVGADLVRIDVNDIADLTEEYVGQGNDSPGTFSTLAHDVFDGQVSTASLTGLPTALMSSRDPPEQKDEEEEEDEDDEGEEDDEEHENDTHPHKFKSIQDLLESQVGNLERGLSRVPVAFSFAIPAGAMTRPRQARKRGSSESDYVQWDDARLAAVLEQLVDAPQAKRESESIGEVYGTADITTLPPLAGLVDSMRKQCLENASFRPATAVPQSLDAVRTTIVQVKDLNDICRSKLGEVIATRLAKVVQKRRRLGEKVIVVGTSTTIDRSAAEMEDSPFLSLVVPNRADSNGELALGDNDLGFVIDMNRSQGRKESRHGYHKILEINMRNIGSMLRRLQPDRAVEQIDAIAHDPIFTPNNSMLGDKTIPQEMVHRLVLTAIGLAQTSVRSEDVQALHIMLAALTMASADQLAQTRMASAIRDRIHARFAKDDASKSSSGLARERIDRLKKDCNTHETKLLSGVVDAQSIKTGFDDVHVAPETIEALKTLTSLSLLRPDAFKYGVLAKDNLSGLMLYGPPGTGKTLLAKAVAKESKATVLEVSGAQVYEKYVGEGEKMVRAVFTLAKKLSPCVVFIDEADALFGTRNGASNRSTHRELINQFLREWDGMDDHKVFIMVATNRPFDVDDAVLRRLPRRLLVDLPLAKDREDILNIHLRDEAIDSAVALSTLAEQTPLYSGSDLKNLCVSAALAAVREENDLAAKHADDKDFVLPKKRTLHQRHFDKGLQEISASISENMSSLNAIRKFDEQYGDRKGRRKKTSYGFGAVDAPVDETAARVRQ